MKMNKKEWTSVRISQEVLRFLTDCKHKSRSKSIEAMLRRVGGSIWEACEEIEKEYNIKFFDEDHEGKEDYFVYNPKLGHPATEDD